MTYIKTTSEDITGIGFSYPMAERYEQRLSQALRTAENRFYNGLKQQKAGGIWDEDTKLIRFGVRDYDPEVGRWTSVEPLGFSGSRNWYVYAGNDGVNYLDLDGRKKINYGKSKLGKQDIKNLRNLSSRLKNLIDLILNSEMSVYFHPMTDDLSKKYGNGYTYCKKDRCDIFYDSTNADNDLNLTTLAHELGHVLNWLFNKRNLNNKWNELFPIQLENIVNRKLNKKCRSSYQQNKKSPIYNYGLEIYGHFGIVPFIFDLR